MLNAIWLALVVGSVLWAGFTGRMEALQKGMLDGAKSAIDLVLGLVGIMAFFLGLMRIARDGGLLLAVSRALAPLLRRLFPDVPPDHPAMGAMIMNLASNMLGLGNAATPFGLKAMVELERLNARPGVATDAIVLFVVINATVIHLFPLGTIAVRAGAGSVTPAAIWIPTLLATLASCTTAVGAHFLLRGLPRYRAERFPIREGAPSPAATAVMAEVPEVPGPKEPPAPASPVARLVILGVALGFVTALVLFVLRAGRPPLDVLTDVASNWLLPGVVVALVLVGLAGRVRVYEAAVEGAKEALEVAARIAPFLVVILVAVAMFRASGLLDLLISVVDPVTSRIGFPAEALPMAILRPLSGSGAFGVMSEILKSQGPDSFVGMLVSTLQGSTETTFYVLAVYFGAAGVKDGRHALACCLLGDLAGFAMATAACHLFFSA
ncbi:MAG TPA: nucleoside recognition domain-containing protein [Myxococcota bacterium]|nr:nucleoside recognition domain-containing protein [Myxococcota bacterium]